MTNIERIIAKIDNDFNIDNSDWIPRVGAWIHDALGLLGGLQVKAVDKWLTVKDRVAYSNCKLDKNSLKVFDRNGCEVKSMESKSSCSCINNNDEEIYDPTTGNTINLGKENKSKILTPNTVTIENSDLISHSREQIAGSVNYKDGYNTNYIVNDKSPVMERNTHNYVLIGCDKIELNWDTNAIKIRYNDIESQYSEIYECNLPVIPDIPVVVEYVTYYCIYKMLCRGHRHPVFNLKASQYGTNPYYEMEKIKKEAKRAIINNNQITSNNEVEDGNLWESAMLVRSFMEENG